MSDNARTQKKIIFFLLCCGCVSISFNIAAIAAVVPVVSRDLQLPDLLVARIIPYYLIPYGIGALMYAPLTHTRSYRRILATSLAVYAAASAFCGYTDSLAPFLAGRVVMGLAAAGAIPLGLICIGTLFAKYRRGRLVGVFFSCAFFASIIGIVASGLLHWRWLFYIPAMLGGLTAAALLVFPSVLLRRVHGNRVDYWAVLRRVEIRSVFFYIAGISFLYHGVHKWFGVYFDRVYRLDQLMISFLFVVIALAGMMGQVLGGWIADKKSRRLACLTGIVMLSSGTMLLVNEYSLAGLLLILVMIGCGWTIGHNGLSTVLTDFPDDLRPAIASLNSSVRFVSGGLGFWASRLFVEYSFGGTFFAIGLLMIGSVFFLPRIIPSSSDDHGLIS